MGRQPKSAEVRARFFTARASGATLKQAVAAAGVSKTTGHYWLTQSGGVRPRRRRPRSGLRLSLEERGTTISRGLAARKTLTTIAGELGRAVSTVSREVAPNSGPNGYRAARADRLAVHRTARPRLGKLADAATLRRYVEDKLRLRWSPQQISRRLRVDHPDNQSMRVSHETIYTSLFVQAKAVLSTDLTGQLRTRRDRRRPHRRVRPRSESGRIPVYFCNAYSPWQRGSNENSNGLLRQYFPKKTELPVCDPDRVLTVANELNNRPRQTLRWQTPHEVFTSASVAAVA